MKPLLFDFAINRKQDITPNYSYDESLNLNVIEINGIKVPFIKSNCCNLELVTTTKVIREQDDIELNTLELNTKNEAKSENNNIDRNYLELFTKTRIDREKDDEDNLTNYE